jgi:hypothetical protein
VRHERRRVHAHRHALVEAHRPALLDAVLDVDEPDRAEREARVAHQRHVHRERDDVEVRRGQLVTQPEPAHLRVGGERPGPHHAPSRL